MTESNIRVKILMIQNEIAKASGHSRAAISFIINGYRVPSIDMAIDLEGSTSVCREAWLFPERHWNPYIPFDGIQSCMTCVNRPNRINKSIEMSEAHFEKTQDFKGLLKIYETYTGYRGCTWVWREFSPDGMHLLASSQRAGGKPIPEFIPRETFPASYQSVIDGGETLAINHFPYDAPKQWRQEMEDYFGDTSLRSILTICRSGLMFSMYSEMTTIVWTDVAIKAAEVHVERIAEMYYGVKDKLSALESFQDTIGILE